MKFYTVPGFIRKLYPSMLWRVNTGSKELFLTFDDGPTPQLTQWILDVLDQYNAKATFFCVGENLLRYPELACKMREKGHVVANHTFNHLNGRKTKDEDYFKNIEECEKLTGNKLFRPPYGKIKNRQVKHLAAASYKIIMWDILTYDFDIKLDKNKSLKKIKTHAGPGSVIVFHDNKKAEQNLKYLLPATLAYFAQSGYTFSSL